MGSILGDIEAGIIGVGSTDAITDGDIEAGIIGVGTSDAITDGDNEAGVAGVGENVGEADICRQLCVVYACVLS